MIDAVVLAGGVERGEIAEKTGIAHRALLEVGGRPIVHTILAALRGSPEVGAIALVAPEPVQVAVGDDAVDIRVPAGDSFLENLEQGTGATRAGADRLLVLTGDLPLLTSRAVDDLMRQALAARADVAYPIIPRESCERHFPGARRTYVRLREGTFTGGNGVVLARDFVSRRRELIARLYAARKNPLKLAAVLGLRFVIRLLLGRLTIPQLEARAGRVIAGRVAAVISPHPELGFDVDKLEDLLLARRAADSFRSA